MKFLIRFLTFFFFGFFLAVYARAEIKTSVDYVGRSLITINTSSINTNTTDIMNLKGLHIVRCFQGGQYSTLQACHDAASAGDTILVGPHSTGWGAVTISKKLSIIGLAGDRMPMIQVGAITFNLTDSNANNNEVHLKNLFIAPANGSAAIIVPSSAFIQRIRLENSNLFVNSGSVDLVQFNNTTSGSSMYIYDSTLDAGPSYTGTLLHTLGGYVFVRRSSFNNGVRGIKVEGGTTQLDNSTIEYANTGEAVNVIGGTFVSAIGLIRNLNAAGSGINMVTPGAVVLGNQTFDVSAGTGYCIKGTGTLLYDRVSFSNSAATPANVKFQNTITSFTYTTTPTSAP